MNVGEFELVQALDLILPLMRVGETCRIEVRRQLFTNYTGDILIYINYKFNKRKLKLLNYCEINNLTIKKHLNKKNFYCKDDIIFNNPIWYNYYLNKKLSKYKIKQKHI